MFSKLMEPLLVKKVGISLSCRLCRTWYDENGLEFCYRFALLTYFA
jgi:hypothetical protein